MDEINQDLIEKGKLYEELLRRKQIEEETARMVAHDLKGAAAILSPAEQILEKWIRQTEYGNEQERIDACFNLRKHARTIGSNARKASNIIEILTLGLKDYEEIQNITSETSLVDIVDDVLESQRHDMITKKQIGARLYLHPTILENKFEANAPIFTSVFYNLIRNAVNHSMNHSVIDSVIYPNKDKEGIIIEFENKTEEEINSDEIKYLFEKGYRKKRVEGDAKSDRYRVFERNEGIGLHFAQKIITKGLGGTIDIECNESPKLHGKRFKGLEKREYGLVTKSEVIDLGYFFWARVGLPFKEYVPKQEEKMPWDE